MDESRARYLEMLAEARVDVMQVKLGLAQLQILEVVWRYSLAVGSATAWIPSLEVFVLGTGMGKKEVSANLDKLQSYRVLDWEPAKEPKFPHAQRYKFCPRSVGAWLIAPRLANQRSRARAATIDRWLCALNANGGPGQGEFFPQLWDHEDALAEWSPRSDDPPQVRPDRSMRQGTQLPAFRPGSVFPLNPGETRGVLEHNEPPDPWGNTPRVGKYPTPPINDWSDFNERRVSHSEQSNPLNVAGTVGKNPTPKRGGGPEIEADAEERQAKGWPSVQIETRLMRRIFGMFDAWYGPEAAAKRKATYGGIWRWRIRQWPFAVEKALEKASREWIEIKELGGFLNREWKAVWAKRAQLQQEAVSTRSASAEVDELPPDELKARIEASLGEEVSAP